jgi:CRP-like cAMP-binding protein
MKGDHKLELLATVPIFTGCSRGSLETIGRLVDEVDTDDGQVLIRQGESGREFFLILEGQVRIERDGKVIRRLGPGDFMGEIALIDRGTRTASAIADGPGRVGVLAPREFHTLLDSHPDVRTAVLQAFARRVRHLEPDGVH